MDFRALKSQNNNEIIYYEKNIKCSFSVLLLSACAENTPNPISQRQPGNENLSCSKLRQELMDNQTKITNLIRKQNKISKNMD